MASPLHGIAAAALAEHEIVLFFPIDGSAPRAPRAFPAARRVLRYLQF